MKDRKAYDRKHSKKKYAEFVERRTKLVESGKIGTCCGMCKAKAERTFNFHHLWYHPTESDYPRNAKTQWTRWRRLMEAEQHPERFQLFCAKCHRKIEIKKYWDNKKMMSEDSSNLFFDI